MKHCSTVTSSSFGKAWTHRCHVSSRSSGMESSHPKFMSQSCCMSRFTGKAWGCTKANGSNIWLAMDRIPRRVAGFCSNLTFISKLSLSVFQKTPSVLLKGVDQNPVWRLIGIDHLRRFRSAESDNCLHILTNENHHSSATNPVLLQDGWPRPRHLPISNSRRHKRSLGQFPGFPG